MSETLLNSVMEKKLSSFIKSGNYRNTPERNVILGCVMAFSRPFTVKQLIEAVNTGTSMPIARATIYNTINLLVKAQLLRRFYNEGIDEMQYYRVTNSEFVHVVCTSCGKVKEVKDVPLMLELRAKTYAAFTENYHMLCVYGICSACARKMKKNKKNNHKQIKTK